jgi:hypothetical protein
MSAPWTPEGIPQPLQQAEPDVKDDAAVWGGVGEELVDIVGRRPAWSLVGDDLLEKGPADQPAHGMGHQVDPRRTRLRLEGFDEPKQVLGGPFQTIVLRLLPPGAGRDVIEAVDPDAVRRHLVMAFQEGQLPAINQDLVLLIEQ